MSYELPQVLTRIKEIKKIYDLTLEETQRYLEAVKKLEREIHTDTARGEGLRHKEEIFGLEHRQTDTLEERRKRIEIFETLLGYYSFGEIKKLIVGLAGDESEVMRTLSEDIVGKLNIKIALSSEKSLDDIKKRIRELLPAPMEIEIGVRFKRFSEFASQKFSDFGGMTYNELKRKDEE
jgi:hypothetical protein